jgi:hypothetical protein
MHPSVDDEVARARIAELHDQAEAERRSGRVAAMRKRGGAPRWPLQAWLIGRRWEA